MIVHIVMFKFNEQNRDANMAQASDMLNSLMGSVPTLKSMEVGNNFAQEDRAMDLIITTTFDSVEALKEYAIHPEHLKVVEFIKATTEYSKVVDYEK
jgi:hypothetical protein